MNSDFAFSIGSSHDICQDYATNYNRHNLNQIVVCDGCSSSLMTDIGSRVLALAAQDCTQFFPPGGIYFKDRIEKFLNMIAMRFLSAMTSLFKTPEPYTKEETMYDATLLIGKLMDDGTFSILVVGDGAIAIERKDGTWWFINIVSTSGYPYYLSYHIFNDRMEAFKKKYEGVTIFHEDEINPNKWQSDLVIEEDDRPIFYNFKLDNIKSISLLSDGICSFKKRVITETSQNIESIGFKETIQELIQFKGRKGRFVQRRLNKFERQCQERGWYHTDDLSIATMNFGD